MALAVTPLTGPGACGMRMVLLETDVPVPPTLTARTVQE